MLYVLYVYNYTRYNSCSFHIQIENSLGRSHALSVVVRQRHRHHPTCGPDRQLLRPRRPGIGGGVELQHCVQQGVGGVALGVEALPAQYEEAGAIGG